MKNLKITLLSILILAFVISFNFFSFDMGNVNADDSASVYGYAWSDNIGWISFNSGEAPVTYGVSVDMNNGIFSGYAWSDNIGWINFAPVSGFPSSPNRGARLESDGAITGWARALSYGDGWDGWISLSGPTYGVSLNSSTNNFSGYAWGSDVVGWVNFDAVTLNLPFNVVLNANPSSIVVGDSSTLSWTSNSADSCTADWVGGSLAVFGSDEVSPIETTEYTITCLGTGGEVSDSATISVFEGLNAEDDTAVVNEGSFVNINVLSNDAGRNLEIVNVTNPGKGTAINNTTSIRYINDTYGGGSDSFKYTIRDEDNEEDTATVNITIYDCGDGTIQLGEQCDDGGSNGVCPVVCSSSCTVNSCSVCGNSICETGEDFISCPADCSSTFEEF